VRLQRRLSASVATALVVAGSAVSLVGSSPVRASTQATAEQRPVRTVTLVTGDRVTVSGNGESVSAQAGPGRDGVTFEVTRAAGQVRVVPSDAGHLLAAGRLDARLFDVSGLLAAGYDRRADLPLILTGGGSPVAAVKGLAKQRDLPPVKGVAVRQPHAEAAESWRALTGGNTSVRALRSNVGKIWLDGLRRPSVDVSVPQVGAPAAWAAGYTGAGSTVAVLDTGIDDTHPDLAGQVAGRRDFTEEPEPGNDASGHGTHVASTIAGTGATSGGKYRGVAPGARLLDGKVCVTGGCADSWIIAGMTWAAAEQHAEIVNLSLGGPDDPEVVDPVEAAVQTLSEQYGTLFVVSAGNARGVTQGAISSPGTAEAALTVGAVNDEDALADFSRRGPGPGGAVKPDLTAPGVGITAARGRDATNVPGEAGDHYTTLSGTSMAAPHVAGAAAILAQRHADWPGRRLKAALMASAQPNPAYGVYDQGAGRLDVGRAVRQNVTSATGSVSFGRQAWPHTDDEVRSRTVTYHNSGPADVTLALQLTAPQGSFTLDASSVLVPAGGDADVAVTADTRVPGPDGPIGGWLTATAGDLVLRTPVAVHKEVESYDVTLKHLDRAGTTPLSFHTTLSKRDGDAFQAGWYGPDPGDTVTLRVPAGHYLLTSVVLTGQASDEDDGGGKPTPVDLPTTLLAQPDLHVNQPLTLTLDARLGQPISVTVPRSSARQLFAEVAAYTRHPQGTAGTAVLANSFATLYSTRIGPERHDDTFTSIVAGQWAQTDADGSTDDSPYLYTLFFPERGRMVTGYRRSVADRELAKVRADFALAQPGTAGTKRVRTGLPDLGVGNFGSYTRFSLPFTRIEYYNTDPGVESAGDFQEWLGEDQLSFVMESSGTRYRVGRAYRERWNRGVFGPALPPTTFLWSGAQRTGDTISLDLPRFGDGAGRPGDSASAGRSTALFRDGTKIADAGGEITVPPGDASYRLELRTDRGAPFALSTKSDIAWTFRSARPGSATPVVLPLWAFRFTPELDQYNTAPANGVHAVPVQVIAQPGADPGRLVSRTVEASFDDGATWKAVRLKGGAALVAHPAGSGFVSLRAKAADSDGNKVEQTILRAYRYGHA
jgi:subtilisin family serine protease